MALKAIYFYSIILRDPVWWGEDVGSITCDNNCGRHYSRQPDPQSSVAAWPSVWLGSAGKAGPMGRQFAAGRWEGAGGWGTGAGLGNCIPISIHTGSLNLQGTGSMLLCRVVKSHHKFMLASYMMQIAKFLAILHHNASFYNFCIIINSFHCLIFSKYWRVIVVSVSHHSAAGCGWWARLAGAF